ncbi:MAG: PEPxxWA-CTERM sorting domain-containing protein, partial [Proteobacteria bacterium]|nr:PEPxxWA-CTERM sorting domain-containing protein [Pseudomonadota bacterium]
RRRRAFALALLGLATVPTALQIELFRGGRLDALRVLGPVDAGGGGGARAAARRRGAVAAAADRPAPLRQGAAREARASEFQPPAGQGPSRRIEAAEVGAPPTPAEPVNFGAPLDGISGADSFALPLTPASFGGGGTTLVTGPATPTPPATNPIAPPAPPPPVIPPTDPTDPGTPAPPVVVTDPTQPTGGTDPGWPQVTAPIDPGGPGPLEPAGPSPVSPGGPGAVPEPKAWAELIAGFGLAGTLLRRRRRQVSATALRACARA